MTKIQFNFWLSMLAGGRRGRSLRIDHRVFLRAAEGNLLFLFDFWRLVIFFMGLMILVIIFFLPGGILGYAEERMKERIEKLNEGKGSTCLMV